LKEKIKKSKEKLANVKSIALPLYKISDMEKTCSITIVSASQVRACLKKSRPESVFTLEWDLSRVTWPIDLEERKLFASPIAPEGFMWLVVQENGFPELVEILNNCEQ